MDNCVMFMFISLLTIPFVCSSQDDFLSVLLKNSEECAHGIVKDITSTREGDCVVDKVKGQSSQIANTQLQVIEYTWTSGGKAETTDTQCICAYKLLRQLINGTVPDLICDASSPILCTKFCKQWSSTNGSGIGTCNSETTCEFNCIMRTTFPMNGTQVYALFTGLGCTVLKGHIQDICRILIEPEHTSTAAIQPTNSTHLFSISEHTSTTAIQPTLNSSYVIQTSILHQYSTPVFTNLPTDLSNPAIYAIIGLSVGLMVLVIATATSLAIVCCIFQWRREKKEHLITDRASPAAARKFTSNSTTVSLEIEQIENNGLLTMSETCKDMFAKVLLSSTNIRIMEELGEGAFCKVKRGILSVEEDGYPSTIDVAVKHLKSTCTTEEVEEFISESAIMLDFDHPNILQLIGVCFDTNDSLPLIILPYMSNGDLKSFLIKKRVEDDIDTLPQNLTLYHLMSMCLDIAKGMEYLAKNKYVHRDLAARNCMVNDKLSVKVADFGFSRDVYSTQYYRLERKTKLPVKWLPPESLLDNVYSERSDVWSYGVTCWEVFSLGRGPYPGVDNADIAEYIYNGNRLKQPPLCSDDMYSFLQCCWLKKASERPTFTVIVDYFIRFLENEPHPDHSDLQDQEPNRPYFVLEVAEAPPSTKNSSDNSPQ